MTIFLATICQISIIMIIIMLFFNIFSIINIEIIEKKILNCS